ncbi:MAG: endonuclease [Tannerella sp.]|jgi:endonuclease/exonuclease/phosphatase family metal-dependent hydrolase|nr:endonuclease [Tannerella sp.]
MKNKYPVKRTICLLCILLWYGYFNALPHQSKSDDRATQPLEYNCLEDQHPPKKHRHQTTRKYQDFRVMFYNVENLFDTYDDPHKSDNEFLPDGGMRWTTNRYYRHLRKTAQVISAIGEWGTPAVCGLCEVENDTVLVHLLNRTPLKEQLYSYCITTGNDIRGINNALLYQRDKFKYLGHSSERIRFANKRKRSRDILHVWGELINGERLNIFVCHFPSRTGGEKETEPDRLVAAKLLRKLCDSVLRINDEANIIVMGDFNDNPYDKSIQAILKGSKTKYDLIDLFDDPKKLNFYGTYKFRGEWSQLDQMIISKNWNQYLKKDSPRIFAPGFLLTKKNSRGEQSPLRKYTGKVYKGGYSDHLPVVADFSLPLADTKKQAAPSNKNK